MDAAARQGPDLEQDKKRWRHSAGFRPAALAVLEFFGMGDGAMAGEGGAIPPATR